jgi:hypothetical protein
MICAIVLRTAAPNHQMMCGLAAKPLSPTKSSAGLRRELGAARRQCDRFFLLSTISGKCGAAKTDRAERDARGGPSNPADPAGTGQWGAHQSGAIFRSGVDPPGVRDPSEIERAVRFARGSNGGLIVVAGGLGSCIDYRACAATARRSDRGARCY